MSKNLQEATCLVKAMTIGDVIKYDFLKKKSDIHDMVTNVGLSTQRLF